MLLNLSSFSQTGTDKVINDSVVVIKKSIAKLIAKDLVQFDALKKIDSVKSESIVLLKKQIRNRDSVVFNLKQVNDLSNQSYINASKRYDLLNELYVIEKKQNKKQRFKTTISQVFLSALVIFLSLK